MGDVARPMLAEVLAAITSETYVPAWEAVAPRVRLALDAALLSVPDGTEVRPGGARWEWTVADPADAQERLVSRGLLPEGWCGDVRRGWYFDDTHRTGTALDSPLWYGSQPRTIPDLVAVVSLGWPAIQRAEELARAACAALREYGCPQPERVVWRVGGRGPAERSAYDRGSGLRNGLLLYADGGCAASDSRNWVRGVDVPAARALWLSGLALDAITADAVRIVVPPVGGVR